MDLKSCLAAFQQEPTTLYRMKETIVIILKTFWIVRHYFTKRNKNGISDISITFWHERGGEGVQVNKFREK